MGKAFDLLTIKDSFMFYAAMMDSEQCRKLLELVLGLEVEEVTVRREEVLIWHPKYHGVRLDVLAKEKGKQRRFNVEMQVESERGLEKRTRYYHSQLDSDALLTGKSYEELPDTYVIFICDFDPFGDNLYRYHFEMACMENGTLLKDGAHTIFLSTKGKNKEEVPEELVNFLEYVADPANAAVSNDSFVKSLDAQVAGIKLDREWRSEYMLLELMLEKERKYGHAEGLAEGLAAGITAGETKHLITQCVRKLRKGRSEEQIADELETDISLVISIVAVAGEFAPEYNTDQIYDRLIETSGNFSAVRTN